MWNMLEYPIGAVFSKSKKNMSMIESKKKKSIAVLQITMGLLSIIMCDL